MAAAGVRIRPSSILGEAEFNEVFLDDVFIPTPMSSATSTTAGGSRWERLAFERVAIATGG